MSTLAIKAHDNQPGPFFIHGVMGATAQTAAEPQTPLPQERTLWSPQQHQMCMCLLILRGPGYHTHYLRAFEQFWKVLLECYSAFFKTESICRRVFWTTTHEKECDKGACMGFAFVYQARDLDVLVGQMETFWHQWEAEVLHTSSGKAELLFGVFHNPFNPRARTVCWTAQIVSAWVSVTNCHRQGG